MIDGGDGEALNLHWYHVTGCRTLLANGDPAALATAYAISPPQFITSP